MAFDRRDTDNNGKPARARPPVKATMVGLAPPPHLADAQQQMTVAGRKPPPPPTRQKPTKASGNDAATRAAQELMLDEDEIQTLRPARSRSQPAPEVKLAPAAAPKLGSPKAPVKIAASAPRLDPTPEDPRAFEATTGVAFSRTLPALPQFQLPKRTAQLEPIGEELNQRDPLPQTAALAPTQLPAYRAAPIEQPATLPAARIANITAPRSRFRPRIVITAVSATTLIVLGLAAVFSYDDARATDTSTQTKQDRAATKQAAPQLAPAKSEPHPKQPDAVAAVAAPNPPAGSPGTVPVPVSSSKAPSCEQLLGGAFQEKVDPGASLQQSRLANRELVRGNVDAAQKAFCNAALWDGTNINTLLNLAQFLVIRRDGAMAAQWVERALKLDPDNSRGLGLLGDALVRVGKIKEAREAWLAAERTPELDADGLSLMVRRDMEEAQRTLKLRDFARAERLFRRVVAFDPEHAAATAAVAGCLLKLGEKEEAEAWALRAETLKPDSASIQIVLGDVRMELGKRDLGQRHYRRALELDPNDRDAERRVRLRGGS
jgi:tetratricopeptide (TPR) repeat protein